MRCKERIIPPAKNNNATPEAKPSRRVSQDESETRRRKMQQPIEEKSGPYTLDLLSNIWVPKWYSLFSLFSLTASRTWESTTAICSGCNCRK